MRQRVEAMLAQPPNAFRGTVGHREDGSTPLGRTFARRIESILWIAGRYNTGVPLADLVSLSPSDGSLDEAGLRDWLSTRPDLARLEGDHVFSADAHPVELDDRRERAARYRNAAELFLNRTLSPILPLAICVGITGSTAYGEPKSGDDLDFIVVTRKGALWVFVLYAVLAARIQMRTWTSDDTLRPCFNYVLEDGSASQDFGRPRGFIVAREALRTIVLRGEAYYQGLLGAGGWMKEEIPRLYAARQPSAPPPRVSPAPWPIRLANAVLFPLAATFVHLKSLYLNERVRREDPELSEITAQPSLHRLAMLTDRFENLRLRYQNRPPEIPTARAPIPTE
ncbi:MAG: hypothetical protein WB778_05895 [Thermoplasmata archaeon]